MVLSKKTKRNGACKVIKCSMCIRISVCFPGALSCFLRLAHEHESKHFWTQKWKLPSDYGKMAFLGTVTCKKSKALFNV